MNFVFVSYNYSPEFSSPESWLKRIEGYSGVYEYLAKIARVHDVKQIDYEGDYIHQNIHYHFVKFDRQKKHFSLQLNRFVKELIPDIVVVHGLHLPLQLIQLRLILPKKTKIMVQHHAEKPLPGIKKYAQRIADIGVDAYLFASHGLGDDWVKKGNLSSSEKIHEVMEVSSIFYPVERSSARLKTGVKGQPVFLWVGRLNENKDPLNIVSTFLKFAAVEREAKLYMIYHTDELLSSIKELLKEHPSRGAVILVGQIPHSDLLYWFNSADFILSGSFYEGSGTAICEAMSCRCVPIVTDISSFQMITDHGKCGILYEAGSETALLAALMQTREMDIEEKQRLCLAYFKSTLSFEAIARQIYEIAGSL
ncbi:glycosyltransferase family 4 protein [Pedobacter sp. L105]|uniref:glycosyltransferase family 4 protein n=1 Tax=Pedobacter sp. L105 TaxID=1641871 RepID=UPI00131B805D|nr:glycosyltransferase [Pedobacter sp. L105]